MPWSFEACSPTLNAALGNICNADRVFTVFLPGRGDSRQIITQSRNPGLRDWKEIVRDESYRNNYVQDSGLDCQMNSKRQKWQAEIKIFIFQLSEIVIPDIQKRISDIWQKYFGIRNSEEFLSYPKKEFEISKITILWYPKTLF